jgi:hypothetical protein
MLVYQRVEPLFIVLKTVGFPASHVKDDRV